MGFTEVGTVTDPEVVGLRLVLQVILFFIRYTPTVAARVNLTQLFAGISFFGVIENLKEKSITLDSTLLISAREAVSAEASGINFPNTASGSALVNFL